MNKRRKLWLSVGAFILTGGAAANSTELTLPGSRPQTQELLQSTPARTAVDNAWAQAGEGGEGGEGGINLETVADDPVEYAMALQVIAAHYDAGLRLMRVESVRPAHKCSPMAFPRSTP